MSSRAEKLRRRQHRKDKKHRQMRNPGAEPARPRDLIIFDPPGQAKMSEALHALVEPEWNECADEAAVRKLLTLGQAAWNAALIKGAARTALLEKLSQTFPIEVRESFRQVIEPLIRRKEELFPHIQRPILSYEVTWPSGPAGEPYLTVISGLA
jgi:hypothetical protein